MSVRRRLIRPLLGLAVLAVAGCGTAGEPSPSATTPEPTASPTPTAEPSPTPAPDAAPAELAGRWRRAVDGVPTFLTLDETGYHIQRGPESASGRISVTGEEIEFSGSRCDGRGVYIWSFEEGRLRFTEIVEDPCSGRTDVLLRGTFGRVDE